MHHKNKNKGDDKVPKTTNMYLYKVTSNVSKVLLEHFEDEEDKELSASLFGIAASVTIAKAFLCTAESKQEFEQTKKIVRTAIMAQLSTLNELDYQGEK